MILPKLRNIDSYKNMFRQQLESIGLSRIKKHTIQR